MTTTTTDQVHVVEEERVFMPIVIQIDTDRFTRYSYWITKDGGGVFHVRCYRESPLQLGVFHFTRRQWSVATIHDLATTLFHMTPAMINADVSLTASEHENADPTSIAISIRFSFGVEGLMINSTEFYADVSELAPETYLQPLNDMAPLLGCVMYSRIENLQAPPPPLLART